MPLSDEEQRLLEQMERALVEDDPKFASTLRGTTFARATRARVIIASVAFVAGVAVLMTGAVMGSRTGTVIGIVGFVLMLGSATIGVSAYRGRQAGSDKSPADASSIGESASGLSLIQGGRPARRPRRSRGTASRKPRGSFMDRIEERWQRRRNQNGGGGY